PAATPTEATVEAAADASRDAPAPAAAPRPVVARRGDDRPGATPASAAAAARLAPAKPAPRARPERSPRPEGPARPRLGDAAFRAQRQALERAEAKLRQLAVRAHGEALTELLAAWS